jgi:hypothetical protein
MKNDRIYFSGNPWPEGHRIKHFIWSAEVKDQDVWFLFHLETENYYADREIENDETKEDRSEWEAPIVWSNYHACTISSSEWHSGGFKVCPLGTLSLDFLDGLKLHVDPVVGNLEDKDIEALAFNIYLLGHDSVADHHIDFHRIDRTDLFNISWCGKIALTYVGNYKLEHDFHTVITAVKMPTP